MPLLILFCVVCCVNCFFGAGGRSGVGRVAERFATGDGDITSPSHMVVDFDRFREGVGVGCCGWMLGVCLGWSCPGTIRDALPMGGVIRRVVDLPSLFSPQGGADGGGGW